MIPVSIETRLVREEHLFTSDIDDEIVMADMQNDAYYGLDSIGSRIWQLLEEPRTLHEICQRLIEVYAVEESICQSEVVEFAQQLLDRKIVRVVYC